MLKKILYTFTLLFALLGNATAQDLKDMDQNNLLYMELKDGIVVIEMLPDIAPNHVLRIRQLTRAGFYDGLPFHRVIDGFMAQTGDPKGNGTGKSKLFDLNAEFSDEMHTRGTVSMARSADPNSANSQFFIITGEYFPHLDGKYTVWGRVIEGMEYVDNIKKGDPLKNGLVEDPDKIIKLVLGSDLVNNKTKDEEKNGVSILDQLKQIKIIQEEKLKSNPETKRKSLIDIMLELDK